jgi:hypothetical protein
MTANRKSYHRGHHAEIRDSQVHHEHVAGAPQGLGLQQKRGLPNRCCYITVDSATTAHQNGACTYRCISKQMHYKTPSSHNGYMKSLEFNENYITLFCLEKKQTFDNIILTQNHEWHITQVVKITI